jgi:hypothetical protein
VSAAPPYAILIRESNVATLFPDYVLVLTYSGTMDPKKSQFKWKMNSDPVLKRVTYTTDTGHIIKRNHVYGVKSASTGQTSYSIISPEGGKKIPGITRWPTLKLAKAHAEKHLS